MKFSEFREKWSHEMDSPDKLSKWEFASYSLEHFHCNFWDYCRVIKETEISSIEIKENEVIFTVKGSDIKITCSEQDQRAMPLDMLNFNSYEKNHMHIIFKILDYIKVTNIVDIGANIGYTACTWAKRYPGSLVFAYEPIPSTFEILKRNVILNQLENIKIENIGLSDAQKEEIIYFYPWCTANSSVKNLQHTTQAESVQAKFTTLDQCFEFNDKELDFLKCDVEGNELYVIKGGINTISRHLPVISMEIMRKYASEFSYSPNEILALLFKLGYDAFYVDSGLLHKIEQIKEETTAANFIFLHGNKHKDLIWNLTKTI